MDFDEARVIAHRKLEESDPEGRMVMLDDQTIERVFGWVFRYNSRQYLESGDFMDMVPGVGPLVVFRHDGSAEFLTTSKPADRSLDEIEERWLKIHGGGAADATDTPR